MMRRLLRRAGGLSLCLAGLFLLAADNPQVLPQANQAQAQASDNAAKPDETAPNAGAPNGDAAEEPAPNPAVQPAAAAPADEAADKPADAQQPATARPFGRMIRIPLPITGSADLHVKRAVQRALAEMPAGGPRGVLVFEFAGSQGHLGQGSDFGRALALARYLSSREVSGAKTVAYIPKALKGQAVLVAMACEEIVMAPDAQIGEAGIDEPAEEAIGATMRTGYQEIANRRRTIPGEVALGMLDKNLEVLKVETEVSPLFVLSSELDEVKKKHTIQSQKILSRPGRLASFSGREARELGFVKFLAPDRSALAGALGLAPHLLDDDPSLSGDWQPVHIRLKGPINSQLTTRVQRTIEDQARDENANFICLWIDSPGGSLSDSMALANFLADLDRAKIRTVAYVPNEARADAALVALACDQLVMNHDAVLGGAGAANFSPEDLQLAAETLREVIAPKKSRSWSLMAALVDPNLHVFRQTHRRDGRVDFFTDDELQAQDDPEGWVRGEEVTTPPGPLRVRGDQALDLHLARHTVDDFQGFKQLYGLEHELVFAEPGWADYLIDALAAPMVAWMLLLIGGAALYAELQAPGIGVGGFVAGVCFLLFFWSKHLDGTAGWLEVLLFAAGVCCILLELFVLPGSAIFGLGGGLLIIASLVLASQTFVLPRNDYQLAQLQNSLIGLLSVAVGVVAVAMLMHRYLPHTPLFSHMMLEPPSDAEIEDLAHRESMVELEHLLGRRGVAATQLTPSGKARFDNELVDVMAEGEVISRGAEVVVVAVHGNYVVVRSQSGHA